MKESELETGDLICMAFDYNSPAELFMPKHKGIRRRATPHYRRFATAAEAIRFAVEEMPAVRTLGARMHVGDERFNSDEISKLYESRPDIRFSGMCPVKAFLGGRPAPTAARSQICRTCTCLHPPPLPLATLRAFICPAMAFKLAWPAA